MKIFALSEGAFTIDKTKQFVPFDLDKDQLNSRPVGSLLVEIQPFVVITKNDIILLDTGLGFSDNSGRLQIIDHLYKFGIEPEAITKVLLSHLHKDHFGGASNHISGQQVLTFKNATYYINKKEVEHALTIESVSYIKKDIELFKHSSQVCLLDDKGVIDNYINYEVSGGHSPHHQAFWIREDNEIIFFGGDVAPQLQQMKSRFVAKYDFEGKKSMELRREWLERGTAEKWKFLFYHDIKNPVYAFTT